MDHQLSVSKRDHLLLVKHDVPDVLYILFVFIWKVRGKCDSTCAIEIAYGFPGSYA